MTAFRSMVRYQIEVAALRTPPLEQLQAGVRRRRLFRRAGLGACGAAALIGMGLVVVAPDDDAPPAELASVGWEDDASIAGPELPVLGDEVIVASGEIGDVTWDLVAYRTSPNADGAERVCSEFRTDEAGPQSCLPVDTTRGSGLRWSFSEVVAGASMYVSAVTPGTSVLLDGAPLDGLAEAGDLPVTFGVGRLDVIGDHTVSIGEATMPVSALIGPPDPPGDGTRAVHALPSLEGAHWERLTSDKPPQDGWIPVAGGDEGVAGYLNPVDMMTELPISPDSDQPPPVDPAPVYDSEGRRVGWFSCRFSTERRTTCGSATTIADSALSSTPGTNEGAP